MITIFVEGDGGDLVSSDVCFDDIALLPTSQPLTPTYLQQCCTFDQEPLGRVPAPLEQSGFTFSATDVSVFEIIPLGGNPSGTHALVIPSQGVHVALPFDATSVVATIAIEHEKTLLTMEAFDATGTKVGTTTTSSEFGTVDVSIAANGITSVFISAEKERVLLIRICATQGDPDDKSLAT